MAASVVRSFFLAVHAHNVACAAAKKAAEAYEKFEDAEAPTKPPKRRRTYILIVDDDKDVRDTFADELREIGWEVETAANGKEALDILDAKFMQRAPGEEPLMPALVILDVFMPVMNGMNFFARLKGGSRPQFEHVPVAIMSAGEGVSTFADWVVSTAEIEHAHDGSVTKPVALGDFIEKVTALAGLPR